MRSQVSILEVINELDDVVLGEGVDIALVNIPQTLLWIHQTDSWQILRSHSVRFLKLGLRSTIPGGGHEEHITTMQIIGSLLEDLIIVCVRFSRIENYRHLILLEDHILVLLRKFD